MKRIDILYPELQKTCDLLKVESLSEEREKVLQVLIGYINEKNKKNEPVFLNFICTHNSRRSQFAQIWAQTAAAVFNVDVTCFSGGVEVTAFNERAVKSIRDEGFSVEILSKKENPEILVSFSENHKPVKCFSKLYDDPENNARAFAAVMTCSHADANCPFIPGTEKRISVTYDDPKEFDGTSLESEKYRERSLQIATEMFYVFSKIKNTK